MKKALISYIEKLENIDYFAFRVAQVVNPGEEFPVVEHSFEWVSCSDDVVADEWYYDLNNHQFVKKPVPVIEEIPEEIQP